MDPDPSSPRCSSTPKKTKNGYLIKWMERIQLQMRDIKIDTLNSKELIVNHIGASPTEFIETLDMHCILLLQNNMSSWFPNANVPVDDLLEKQVLSLTDGAFFPIHISTTKTIETLTWNSVAYDDVSSLLEALDAQKIPIETLRGSMIAEAVGIYVHRDVFGVQWVLRALDLFSNEYNESQDALLLPNRMDIETQWADDIALVQTEIKAQLAEWERRANKLRSFEKDLLTLFQHAQDRSLSKIKWNELLEELSLRIGQFRSGRLQT
jgi:hypothetical protein